MRESSPIAEPLMDVPTAKDISPTEGQDLDEKCALEHFLGKTQDEAKELFFEDAVYYECDFKWMGANAFTYYFPTIEPYLNSKDSENDADVLNALLGTIGSRLLDEPEAISRCRKAILTILRYCLKNYSKFEPDPRIYGDLRALLETRIKEVEAAN